MPCREQQSLKQYDVETSQLAWAQSSEACVVPPFLPQGPALLGELPMLSRLRVPHVPAEVLTLYSPDIVQGKPGLVGQRSAV